jgi:predicted ribonuclease YlaK
MVFYDTCSLLNELHHAFEQPFYISSITLKELESIKTSALKDAEIKFKARKLIHLLDEYEDKYTVVNYQKDWDYDLKDNSTLSDNNDSRIILTALKLSQEEEITFITKDICCKQLAKSVGLNVHYISDAQQNYTGYQEIVCKTDNELAEWYDKIFNDESYDFSQILQNNEYLIFRDSNNKVIDKYKNINGELIKVPFYTFNSKMFGKIKPKDEYQALAMDSLETNKITMIRGCAGTGKSYLALGYLFTLLEKHRIDKIIIFCNTVATSGSAKLGYYPGSRTEKLLDSQIGNFLSSKIGDRIEVERLIMEGKIDLLPMSDIRGYDTTGLNAGIYITEAQNLDIELMRLALQRIGEDSICILDGDSDTQVDLSLYAGSNNGMRRVSEIFRGDDLYGEVTLKIIHRSHIGELAQRM